MKAPHFLILGTVWLVLGKVDPSHSVLWHIGSMVLTLVGLVGLFVESE